MKIAVMGMGVAGSYLMARLKDSEHEVVGYERMIQEKHDSICAWGTIKEELTNSGISAIIQPGGSIRDKEVIEAANKAKIKMAFTGIRHFNH